MAKLIVRPSQCAARVEDNYCSIDGFVFLQCPSIFTFPAKCPLPNGIAKKHYSRNRRKCKYYLSGFYSRNNCIYLDRQVPGSLVYAKCIGVNCGQYNKK